MEYHPRYPQPFSLSQAIALDPAVAWDEFARLRNSLLHLRRSQSELQEYLREEEGDREVCQAVKENEITMHDERIFMLQLALIHHGYSVDPGQMSVPLASSPSTLQSGTERAQNTFSSTSGNLYDSPLIASSAVNPDLPEAEERENGVYL